MWQSFDIAQLEQAQPQDDFPRFLFFTAAMIIAETTPKSSKETAIVPKLFIINCTEIHPFHLYQALFIVFFLNFGLIAKNVIVKSNTVDTASPIMLGTVPTFPKRSPEKSEPYQ